jgi:hypothetical protein
MPTNETDRSEFSEQGATLFGEPDYPVFTDEPDSKLADADESDYSPSNIDEQPPDTGGDEPNAEQESDTSSEPTPDAPPPKPKRANRKTASAETAAKSESEDSVVQNETATSAAKLRRRSTETDADSHSLSVVTARQEPTRRPPSILTITAGDEVETEADHGGIIWHEIRNAYLTRKILSGTFGGIEQA